MTKFYWFLGHEQFQPEVLIRHALAAERAGFDGVMVSEHFNPWVADYGAAGFAYATLGALAQATTKLELMTAVTTPLFRYHPAVAAQAAATIDRLSGGRFALGIGSGEKINEAPLGIIFPSYRERSARLNEAITIMVHLLNGEKLSFNGEYYKTTNAKLYSPPLHHLPILVAAGGPQSAALAGEKADGLIVSVKDVDETKQQVIAPAQTAAKDKRLTLVATHWSVYGSDEKEAWEALKPWRGLRAPSRADADDPEELQQEADQLKRSDILSRYHLARSPQDLISAYQPLVRDLHADVVGFQCTSVDQEALIELIGGEVLPRLRALKKPRKE